MRNKKRRKLLFVILIRAVFSTYKAFLCDFKSQVKYWQIRAEEARKLYEKEREIFHGEGGT